MGFFFVCLFAYFIGLFFWSSFGFAFIFVWFFLFVFSSFFEWGKNRGIESWNKVGWKGPPDVLSKIPEYVAQALFWPVLNICHDGDSTAPLDSYFDCPYGKSVLTGLLPLDLLCISNTSLSCLLYPLPSDSQRKMSDPSLILLFYHWTRTAPFAGITSVHQYPKWTGKTKTRQSSLRNLTSSERITKANADLLLSYLGMTHTFLPVSASYHRATHWVLVQK